MITIKGHRRKSRFHSPTFTIRGINRETLSLLLTYAREGIEKDPSGHRLAGNLLSPIEQMDAYVNTHDEVEWLRYRTIEHPAPQGKPLIEVLD